MKYKEFLNTKNGYKLEILPEHAGDDKESGLIEVPDGAEVLRSTLHGDVFYKKNIGELPLPFSFVYIGDESWLGTSTNPYDERDTFFKCTLWQRHTQPEELPFIDDEKSYSHYFKDVSNIEFIDVYRVLDLFAVEHPCIQHAVKKLLCAGQRGSKSRDKDIQEAIDSLQRFQEMRIEDSK